MNFTAKIIIHFPLDELQLVNDDFFIPFWSDFRTWKSKRRKIFVRLIPDTPGFNKTKVSNVITRGKLNQLKLN